MKHTALLLIAFVGLLTLEASAQLVPEKHYRVQKFNKGKQGRKSPKRVYIQSFRILFEVFEESTARTSGSKSSVGGATTVTSGTSTRMGVQIKGVDISDFQKIVDDAYARFVKDLTDQGFEIIAPDEAGATDFLSGYIRKKGGEASLSQFDGHVMVTPTGYEYFVKRETKKGKEKGTFTDKTGKLSKELGDAFVADVNFVFPFVDLNKTESELLNVSAVKGKINYRLENVAMDLKSFVPIEYPSGVKFTAGWKIAPTFTSTTGLKKHVYAGPDVFKDEKFREMTVAARESFDNAAYPRVVMTQGNVTAVATHFAECDPDGYVNFAAGTVNEILSAGVKNFIELTQK